MKRRHSIPITDLFLNNKNAEALSIVEKNIFIDPQIIFTLNMSARLLSAYAWIDILKNINFN